MATTKKAGVLWLLAALTLPSCGGDDTNIAPAAKATERAPAACGDLCDVPPTDVSCVDCPLRLVRVQHSHAGGAITGATLALEHVPSPTGAVPRIGDIRLSADDAARLDWVEPGPALREASKALHVFTDNERPFRQLDDGSWQLLVMPKGRNAGIGPGRLLTLHFSVSPDWEFERTDPRMAFRLVRGEALVLAPRKADAALKATAFDAPVVLGLDDAR